MTLPLGKPNLWEFAGKESLCSLMFIVLSSVLSILIHIFLGLHEAAWLKSITSTLGHSLHA